MQIKCLQFSYIFFISTGLKAVLGQYELFTDRNTRDHLAWTAGNEARIYARGVYPTQHICVSVIYRNNILLEYSYI